MTLHDRVALITGPRRIGADLALQLASRGAHIALSYNRSRAEAEAVVDRIRNLGRKAEALSADLSHVTSCRQLVDQTVARLGRLDVLVNMASVYIRRDFGHLTEKDWNLALDVDLKSAWACAQAAVPAMRAVGGGRIVNFSDWTARSGRPRYVGYLPYYIAKAGVIALTEVLALELAADGILVNCVAPGPIVPPPETSPEEIEEVKRATPLGRWGGEAEIAKAVIALIETDFITGETIRVDGGRHLR
jgi:NAD(P)-dependent dehydrogenase (short-subunit alcohol dehydrogenase family)